MPATPSRIARITRQFLPVVSGPKPEVTAAYGNVARDNLEPVETFFETEGAARAMADERLALLGATRRRFSVGISDLEPALSLPFTQRAPSARILDDERAIDSVGIITGLTLDLQTNDATMKVLL